MSSWLKKHWSAALVAASLAMGLIVVPVTVMAFQTPAADAVLAAAKPYLLVVMAVVWLTGFAGALLVFRGRRSGAVSLAEGLFAYGAALLLTGGVALVGGAVSGWDTPRETTIYVVGEPLSESIGLPGGWSLVAPAKDVENDVYATDLGGGGGYYTVGKGVEWDENWMECTVRRDMLTSCHTGPSSTAP